MNRVSTAILASALAGAVVFTTPAIAQEEERTVPGETVEEFNGANLSEQVRAIGTAVQAAIGGEEAIDVAALRTQMEAAQAAITGDDDRIYVGQVLLELGIKMAQMQIAQSEVLEVQRPGLELAVASNRLSLTQRATYLRFLGDFERQDGNHATAVPLYERLLRIAPNDTNALVGLMVSSFNTNNSTRGYQALEGALQSAAANNIPTQSIWYRIALRQAVQERSTEQVVQISNGLLANHFDDINLVRVLSSYLRTATLDDQTRLDFLRMMMISGVIDGASAAEYAQLASRRGYPAESLAVFDAAVASGEIQPSTTVRDEYQADTNSDRSGLAGTQTSARSAATGGPALSTADAFASHGEYATAQQLYQVALDKGGVDTGTVYVRRGAAYVATGDMAQARTAFEAVSGSRAYLAQIWLQWLDNQAGAAASAEETAQ
jgi:tetratricopeptide (TPR) repeat protein